MPAGTPYGRTALPTKVVDAAELTSLTDRMAHDLFSLGADHRAEQDAQSLAQITVPDAGVTGTTGYEGMFQPDEEPAPAFSPGTGASSFGESPQRRTALMAMPAAPDLPTITPRRMAPDQGQSFELPGTPETAPVSFTATPGGRGGSAVQAIPYPGGAGATSSSAETPRPGDIEAYLRHAAASRGIDPDIAVRVARSEGGLDDPVRQSDVVYQGQREQSYGPLQLNVNGGVGSAALRAGIDPRNPAQWRQALDFGLDEVARSGWGQWHGAARVGIGSREGIGSYRGPPPPAPPATAQRASEARGAAGERAGSLDTQTITQAYQGVPYVFGGAGGRSDPTLGAATDCSGFVSSVWKNQYGLDLAAHTDTSYNQLKQLGATDVAEADARPGDVVYYMGAGTGGAITHHMGIVSAPGRVLDMSVSGGGGVRERDIGHAGRHVILRDPRVNQEMPKQPLAPPPIVPSGDSGGQPISHADASALQLEALSFSPSAISGSDAGMAGGGEVQPTGPPERDDYRTAPTVQSYDPDQGPREALPGSAGAAPYLGPLSTEPEMVTPPAQPSPYDTDQPFRPTPRLGQPPAPVPIAEDVVGPTRQAPPAVASTPWYSAPIEAAAEAARPVVSTVQDVVAPAARAVMPNAAAAISGAPAALGAAGAVLGPALEAMNTANEWLINNPVAGALNPQAWGRELGGTDQLYTETHEDQQRLEALIGRFRAGDTSVEPEIQALTASLNQRTQGDRASLLAAGERNPNKGAETLGQIVQAGAATAIAPSLAAGRARNVVGAALDPLGQGLGAALELPGRAQGAARRVAGALADNAQATAAADARMAAQGSTAAPGVFGLSGIEPDLPAVQGMRPRIIPPQVADELDFPVRNPTDPAVLRAIEAAGGTVDERGVTLNVIRNQGPEAHGGTATRGMPFYIAGPKGTPNPYASAAGAQTGGPVRIEGETRFRSPLMLSDPPGNPTGFNEAAEQLGINLPAGKVLTLSGTDISVTPKPKPLTSQMLDQEIQRARYRAPEGSPARAAALKDLVSKYGGDPDLIDDLLAVRGADHSESAWAIKENIVAGNARKQQYDGVVTVQPNYERVKKPVTPEIQAAYKAHEAARGELQRATREAQLSGLEDAAAERRLRRGEITAAERAAISQRREAALVRMDELEPEVKRLWDEAEALAYEPPTGKITELADVREARNPTPGSPNADMKAAYKRAKDAERAVEEQAQAMARAQMAGDGMNTPEQMEAMRAARQEAQEANAALDALMNEADTPTGYELRPDVPRRPGSAVRESTIEENPGLAETERNLQTALNALDPYHAQYMQDVPFTDRRMGSFEEWARRTGNERAIELQQSAEQAEAAFEAAQAPPRYRTAQNAAIPRRGPGSEIAQASAGALAPTTARPDRLAAVNRALSQGVVSSVSGGVGAQVNQELNPDDPYAGIKGFAAGALVPPLAARGGRALARAAGRSTDLGSAARIGLGDVPPSRVGQQGLPGIEHPPYTRPQLPDVSETPNAPGNRLGNVPPSQVGQPGLPGMEPEPATDLATFADRVLGLTGEPAATSAARGTGGQTFLAGTQPGKIQQIRAALEPWWNRLGIVRYAGMLSDTAGHVQNVVGNLAGQLADIADTAVMLPQDVARVGASRAVGRAAEREVFASEIPARLAGMKSGVQVGMARAIEIMRTGIDPAQATKLDQGPRGFGTDIPGLAPAGSRRAGAVNAAFEGPLRALGAADAVFRGSAEGGHLAAESLALATKRNAGKAPSAAQIRAAMFDPDLRKQVDELAARSVLQEDRRITTWYRDDVVGRAPTEAKTLLQTVIPWVRTPYNIMAQGLGMTDVGALVGVINDIRLGKGARNIERRVARAAIGTAVGSWAAAEYAAGDVTGPYPSDQGERSTLPPGWRPWSKKVEFGGETYYLPLAALGPFAVPAVYQILRGEAIKQGADPFSKELLGDVAMGIGRYAEQNTFLEGLGTISKLFDERTGEANFGRLLEQTLAQYSPHVLGGGGFGRELQRIMGMPSRDPEGLWEAMLATHPLTAGQVRPRQDVLGREQSLGIGGPAGAVIRGGVEDDAGVISAFRSAGEGLASSAPKTINDPSQGRTKTLDEDQRARWERVYGRELRSGWTNAGNPRDADTLKKIKADASKAANETLLGLR